MSKETKSKLTWYSIYASGVVGAFVFMFQFAGPLTKDVMVSMLIESQRPLTESVNELRDKVNAIPTNGSTDESLNRIEKRLEVLERDMTILKTSVVTNTKSIEDLERSVEKQAFFLTRFGSFEESRPGSFSLNN